MPEIESVVFANDHMVLYIDSAEPQLLIKLTPDVVGLFERIGEQPSVITSLPLGMYISQSKPQKCSPGQLPSVSLSGVLYRRSAAILVEQEFAAYRSGVDAMPRSVGSDSAPPSGIPSAGIANLIRTPTGLDVPRDEVGYPISPSRFGPGSFDRASGTISFVLDDKDCPCRTPPAEN